MKAGPDSTIGNGQRTGPGFEGARCPGCGAHFRLISGLPDEVECGCGARFTLNSLGDASSRLHPGASGRPATLLVHASGSAQPPLTMIEKPRREGETESGAGTVPGQGDVAALPRFGKYELLGEIARGGMGVVYRARQAGMKREVALKMLLAGEGADEEQIRRFMSEAESAAKLSHPGIVPIYDVGFEEGRHYFAMEFIQGESLSAVIDRMGLIPPRLALKIARDAAVALHFAHEKGIVHRDVKPGNIMIAPVSEKTALQAHRGGESVAFASGQTATFRVVLTDFGLAKDLSAGRGLTVSGATLGTPVYMPPEQADGDIKAIGPTSDVYSIGAVLYEMVTGCEPFSGESVAQVLAQVMTKDPVLPSKIVRGLHRDVETIIIKAMAKEQPRRYASALEFAEDIERYLRGEMVRARRASLAYRARKALARNKALAAGTLAVLVAAAAAAAFYAERAAARALRTAGAAQSHVSAGWAVFAQGDMDGAEKEFRAAAAILQDSWGSRLGLRQVRLKRLMSSAEKLLGQEKYDAAAAMLEEAVIIEPANTEVERLLRIARGTATLALGKGCGGAAVFAAPVRSGILMLAEACPSAGALIESDAASRVAVAPFGPIDRVFGDFWLVVEGPKGSWCRYARLVRNGALEVDFATLRVGSSADAGFATIGQAIEAAKPGNTIEIEPGDYREEIWVTKPFLTIRGAHGGEMPRVGGDLQGCAFSVIRACGTKIERIRVLSGKQGGVYALESPGFALINSAIEGGEKEGVTLDKSPMSLVAANEVSGCLEPGIVVRNSENVLVAGNRVRKVGWAGIIISGDHTSAARNICEDNMRMGIFLNASRGGRIIENVCRRNPQWGIAVVEMTEGVVVEGNLVTDTIYPDGTQIGRGIQIGNSKNGFMRRNTVWRSTAGVVLMNAPGCLCRDNIVHGGDFALWLDGAAGAVEGNWFFGSKAAAMISRDVSNTLENARLRLPGAGYEPMGLGVWQDPLLSDPESGDFSLRPNSPCRGSAEGGRDAGADWEIVREVLEGRFELTKWLRVWNAMAAARSAAAADAEGRYRDAAGLEKLALAFAGQDKDAVRAVEETSRGGK